MGLAMSSPVSGILILCENTRRAPDVRVGWSWTVGTERNEVGHKTRVEDLERVVKMRKYQHCEAEYSRLAKEPNTMPKVRDRYLRIAQYYRELADTEPTGA